MDVFSVSADSLFPIASEQNAQREQFAMRFLQKGLEEYTAKNYDAAILSFRQAVGLAPQSEVAVNAYTYVAQSYMKQDKTEAAIDTYKTLQRLDPSRDTTHTALGNLYYAKDRFTEASAEYAQAARINPSSANLYAVGQGYLATGQAEAALRLFATIRQQEPTQPQGAFGMGQAYAKLGRYDEAIATFKSAIGLKKDYWGAYLEMGYAYTDSGDVEKANEIASKLQGGDTALAALLTQYIYEKSKPRMVSATANDSFPMFLTALGPGTQVADLGNYLSGPGDEQLFALNFLFSKAMDRLSVENTLNWSISRAVGSGLGDGYYTHTPDTEVTLPAHPYAVYYDTTKQTATVLFKVRQNDTANGTINPAHINFAFKGVDDFGLSMDPGADVYSGYSGFA